MRARAWKERGVDPGWLPPTDRGRELFSRYRLASHAPDFGRESWEEILGTLDLLDRIPASVVPGERVLDVGAKNWAYLPALAAWVASRRTGRRARITGVEIAGSHRYWDLSTRESRAHWYMQGSGFGGSIEANYVSRDFRVIQGRFDLITWFFPFLSIDSHRSWGLKRCFFDPAGLFDQAGLVLEERGTLILANHGDWEWERSGVLLKERGWACSFSEQIVGSLHAGADPIWLSVWTRS